MRSGSRLKRDTMLSNGEYFNIICKILTEQHHARLKGEWYDIDLFNALNEFYITNIEPFINLKRERNYVHSKSLPN